MGDAIRCSTDQEAILDLQGIMPSLILDSLYSPHIKAVSKLKLTLNTIYTRIGKSQELRFL